MVIIYGLKKSIACVDFPGLIFAVKVFLYLFILKDNCID